MFESVDQNSTGAVDIPMFELTCEYDRKDA